MNHLRQTVQRTARSMALLSWICSILVIEALAPIASRAQPITIVEVRVGARADDAEEKAPGNVILDSRDLEFTFAKSEQTVGLRFTNVDIPPGATITSAYLELEVDATHSAVTVLEIAGESTAHALPFAAVAFDISARPRTAAVVDWMPPPWSAVGALELTPDLAGIVQDIVDGPGWESGNALALIVTGSGRREAVAYDGQASAAPLLHIEYTTDGLPASSTTTSSTTTTTLPLPGGGIGTPENLAVMYIGDGPDRESRAAAIYGLATSQGVDAIVHSGDTDYGDDADVFWSRVHSHLGTAFPYFVSVGNHDDSWPDYQDGGEAQCARTPGALCVGDYGVNSTVFYKGLTIVLSGVGMRSSGHEAYLREEFAASDSIWKICSWHLNQHHMQLGSKGDEPGWGVYDACRDAGAFIVNGHEHTYSRTRTLIDMEGLGIDPGAPDPDTLFVGPGRTFLAVSGLAGSSVRNQDRCVGPNGPCTTEGNECVFSTGSGCEGIWAAFYGEDKHGGLIIRYHVDGDPWKARGRFFSVDGVLRDEFVVFSEHALPTTTTTTTMSTTSTTGAASSTTSSTTMATTTSTTLPPLPTAIDVRVATSVDDAEQRAPGDVVLGSSDLEFTFAKNEQIVGMRFVDVDIPAGATIVSAHLEFEVDATHSGLTTLEIAGQATANALPFAAVDFDVSSRPRTVAVVGWIPPPWSTVGALELTPDIATIIQEIVTASGWESGNALAIIVTGSGRREAVAYDGQASAAPLLHVEYTTGGLSTSSTTSTTATTSTTVTLAPTTTTITTSTTSTLAPTSTTVTTSTTEPALTTTSTTTTLPPVPATLEIRVNASTDDAEEAPTGQMRLISSDLEFIYDRSDQTTGLRFVDVAIPRGATIVTAYVQLQVDEVSRGLATLQIAAEAVDNAATFAPTFGNMTDRPLTTAVVDWQPAEWPTVGAIHQTGDIGSVLQEIIDRPGWVSGNAIAVIVSGSGRRVAESFDGTAPAAPLLHVDYLAGP